jgi:hypothetical protein
MSKALKEAGWRLILPEIRAIVKEEIAAATAPINVRIDEMDKRLSDKIDSLRNELKSDISRLDSKVEDLDKRLEIVQRLSVLEA